MPSKDKVKKTVKGGDSVGSKVTKSDTAYSRHSVFDFMEFDKVEDNMIIQKNGKRFLMVLECQGINYDLMSGIERTSVEQGFQQFLNALRHPVQIYTQTRTINLGESLQTYKRRLENIKLELERKEARHKQMQVSGSYTKEELQKQYMEVIKDRNLYEYGQDIIYYTEKMCLNKSVLRKQYYVIIPYYSSESGSDLLDKDEIKNLAFSELYTRAQALARVLAGCSITSKVLDSYELVDLLYTAYNRDESEVYGLKKAIDAEYDEMYSTGQDVMDKRMAELNRAIEERGFELAKDAVAQARTEKSKQAQRKERSMDELIKDIAKSIIEENKQYVGEDVAEIAKGKIEEKEAKEKGGNDNVKKAQKYTRRVIN